MARPLQTGDRGDDVTALQTALRRRLRARDEHDLAPDVDGILGPQTIRAAHRALYLLGVGGDRLANAKRGRLDVVAQQIIRNPNSRVRYLGMTARALERKAKAAKAANARPRIVTSAALGLRFSYPWGIDRPPVHGAGHYTAGPVAEDLEELREVMRSVHAQHAAQGWGGMSYDALFAMDGSIGLGNPANRLSAAVASFNTGLWNLCTPGTTGHRISPAAKRSIRWYLAHAHTTDIPVAYRAPVDLRRIEWRGHKEWPGQATACPGDMLIDYREVWQ